MKKLKEMLTNEGFEFNENNYSIGNEKRVLYFNLDDDGNFTTVTLGYNDFGGQEEIIYDKANIKALEEIIKNGYDLLTEK